MTDEQKLKQALFDALRTISYLRGLCHYGEKPVPEYDVELNLEIQKAKELLNG